MDILLIIYCLLLGILVVFPFLVFGRFQSESEGGENRDLLVERKILLENLRDLKTDMETGKISRSELDLFAVDIAKKLETIDSQIPSLISKNNCPICRKEQVVADAKFCSYCGANLEK